MSGNTDIPQDSSASTIHLGVAGWNLRREHNVAQLLDESAYRDISTWCIFDNTALGAATADALTVKSHLLNSRRAIR
jgi:hypothetical protein